MSGYPDDDRIWAGLERRLAVLEGLIPPTPEWHPSTDASGVAAPIVLGPALRRGTRDVRDARRTAGTRRLLILLAAAALLVAGVGAAAWVASQRPALIVRPTGNGLIAYTDGGDIWAFDPQHAEAGGDRTPRRLTSGPDIDLDVAWSPDGRQLAFVRRSADAPLCGTDPCADLMVLDTTDGGLRTLARDLAPLQRFTPSGPAFPYPPAWSPDERVIALSVRRPFPSAPGSTDLSDAGPAILTVDVSTGSSRLAEIHLRSAEAPAWSPDGRRLAFIGSCTVVVYDCLHVFVADPDGSRLTDLMPTVRYVADRSLPVWTGDGTSIVATVRDPVHFVVSIPVDGSGPTTLESGSDESGAAVSPDGESIAFQRRSIGPDGEASIAYEWGKHTRSGYRSGILWATWGGWRPVWSPDGAALLGLACPPLFGATGTCELTVGQVEVGPGSGTPPGWPIGEPRDLTYDWQPVAP